MKMLPPKTVKQPGAVCFPKPRKETGLTADQLKAYAKKLASAVTSNTVTVQGTTKQPAPDQFVNGPSSGERERVKPIRRPWPLK